VRNLANWQREKNSLPFKLEGDDVDNVDVGCHNESSRAFEPQSGRSERHGAANVHRVTEHVERESSVQQS